MGKFDFQEFAKNATEVVLKELNLAAVAIFRIDHDSGELKSYAYSVNIPVKTINRILGMPFTKVKAPLGRKNTNFTEDTANSGQIHTSESLEDFSRYVVKKNIGTTLQRILKTRSHISLPIKVRGGIEGVLFCASSEATMTETKISLLKTITTQLGLSMANVMAHERIIKQYEKSLDDKDTPKKKKASIKFTLRINEDIEQYLFFKTHNTKMSKAEFVRDLLQKKKNQEKDATRTER